MTTTPETQTPLTDEQIEDARNIELWIATGKHGYTEGNAVVVPADFARQLELRVRELEADKARLDWLDLPGSFPRMVEASERLVAETGGDGPIPPHTWREAIDAARGGAG